MRVANLWTEKSVANPGEVLIKFNWKQTKEMKEAGKEGLKARFVSAPVLRLALAGDDEVFAGFCEASLADYQRSVIAEFLTEALQGETPDFAPEVPEELFDKVNLLMLWEAEQEKSGEGRGKLSGEAIGEFFDRSVKGPLVKHFAKKAGIVLENASEEQRKKLNQSAAQYKALMMKLSKSESINMDYLKNAQKALVEIAGAENDPIGRRINGMIERRIKAPVTVDSLELL